MDERNAMRRFLKYIGRSFMCSSYKDRKYKYESFSKDVLSESKWLHLPKDKLQYIGIDLDWEGSASLWMDEGYPEPTITIISPKTSHSKYFYELEVPVLLPFEWDNISISLKPYKFYKWVKAGLDIAMGGDRGYSGYTMNNPFYRNLRNEIIQTENGIVRDQFKTHWSDKRYDLQYLSEFAKPLPKSFLNESHVDITSRAMTMFHLTRNESYRLVHLYNTIEDYYNAVLQIALEHWQELRHIQKDHSLDEREARNVANSVSKWFGCGVMSHGSNDFNGMLEH